MDKYNGLLSKVSRQYHILRGTQETEDEWKTRLVYSICGMMAYASLWDDTEEAHLYCAPERKNSQHTWQL